METHIVGVRQSDVWFGCCTIVNFESVVFNDRTDIGVVGERDEGVVEESVSGDGKLK